MRDDARPLALPVEQPEPPESASSLGYGLYLGGLGSWFSAWGMQAVLFSWLVVGVLRETPERVGVAQFALVAPSLLLLLAGGVTADRVDRRRLLALLHVSGAHGEATWHRTRSLADLQQSSPPTWWATRASWKPTRRARLRARRHTEPS